MSTDQNDRRRSRPKSYTQLAKEFPGNKGYAMMADRERVMGHPAATQEEPRANDRVGGRSFQQRLMSTPEETPSTQETTSQPFR